MAIVHQFAITFMAFFAIMNPIANLPVFISLTNNFSATTIKRIALRSLLIATTMNLAVSINPLVVMGSFAVLAVITYFLFIEGELVVAKLGSNLMNVITRMMGLILATIGVHMAVVGLQAAFPVLH